MRESSVSEQKGCVTAVALWVCPGDTMKRTEAITLIVRARGETSQRLVKGAEVVGRMQQPVVLQKYFVACCSGAASRKKKMVSSISVNF